MNFEITNDEEATALIDSIIADMQRIVGTYYKVETLRNIRTTIDELITYYSQH